jgi:hypothetical protein
LPSGLVQQIEHAELVSPTVEVFAIQRGSLHFKHRESIVSLPIGYFVARLVEFSHESRKDNQRFGEHQ